MVLAGARRSAGSEACNVDLLDRIERLSAVGREQARQPGRERCTHGHRQVPLARFGAEFEKTGDVGQVVGARHDRRTAAKVRSCDLYVRSARPAKQHDVNRCIRGCRGSVDRCDRTQGRTHCGGPLRLDLSDQELLDTLCGRQLARGTSAHRAGADEQDRGHRRSGPESSRHPPPWGGVPPLPRSRRNPTIAAAAPTAMRARRSKVIDDSLDLAGSGREVRQTWG
jgi:hypothetical protein